MEMIFIVGPMRSGTTLLASLLDGHKDVLVWPFEWQYFTIFWPQVPGPDDAKRVADINRAGERLFSHFLSRSVSSSYSTIPIGDSIDHARFSEMLNRHANDRVDCLEYLQRLGEAFAGAHRDYRHRPPRYFLVKTMVHGLDWRDRRVLESARLIMTLRSLTTSAASYRNKYFGKLRAVNGGRTPKTAYQYYRDQCFPLLYLAKLAHDAKWRIAGASNAHLSELAELRSEPQNTMAGIARFLDIDYHESLTEPTFLNKQFEGHFHDSTLNVGRVVDRETKHPPLSALEAHYLARLDVSYMCQAPLPPVGSLSDRLRAIRTTLAEEPGGDSAYYLGTLAQLISVDLRMGRAWPNDITERAIDRSYIYRLPRGARAQASRALRALTN